MGRPLGSFRRKPVRNWRRWRPNRAQSAGNQLRLSWLRRVRRR